MAGQKQRLTPEARALDADVRETIDTLTPFHTAEKPRRRGWFQRGRGTAWMLFALVLGMVVALLVGLVSTGGDSDAPTGPATSGQSVTTAQTAAPAGGRWYFFDPATDRGLYTIDLLGDGDSGPVDVIEDQTDKGTYTWQGSTLTISFTRVMTMSDGFQFEEPSEFVCTGAPDAQALDCVYRRQAWSYDGKDGLTVEGTDEWPSAAERR